nr:uncharacterized protein LOC111511662 [Leptinotarsa decemlineata]
MNNTNDCLEQIKENKKNVTVEDVYKLLEFMNGNFIKKFESIDNEIKSLLMIVEHKCTDAEKKISSLEAENYELRVRVEEQEKKLKGNNLIVYGIQEEEGETSTSLTKTIIQIFENILHIKLEVIEITNIYRLGRRSNSTRPVLLTLLSNLRKIEILKNCYKLKGSNFTVSEDLTKKEVAERKILLIHLKEAKKNNRQAILRRNKLIIEGIPYTLSDIQTESANDPFSNPGKALSDPSTPLPRGEEFVISSEEEAEEGGKGNEYNKKEAIYSR